MFIEERHEKIIEYLEKNERIMTTTVQDMFNVSFDTARRDLRILGEKGLIRRIRGGALAVKKVGDGKDKECSAKDIPTIFENYYQIAMEAITMLSAKDVIYITGGSIGYIMACNMPTNIEVTAIVNSIIIAEELRKKSNITVIMVGGTMDLRGNCYDSFAVDMISCIKIDKCFFTSACLSVDFGLSIQSSDGICFFKQVLKNSKVVIGLYPTEKVGISTTIKICSINKLDTVILDWYITEEEERKIRKAGIDTVLVEKDKFSR